MTAASGGARAPKAEELQRILRRGVAEIIPEEELVAALRSGRSLRLKMGFDPTKPEITLGWCVGLRKLRQLQELGHRVVLIIGDWTAQIGDPSGQSQTRPMLTAAEVQANAESILRQFFRVLDEGRTEVRWQSEWFGPFDLGQVVSLAARFTVAQMLQRDDFAQRFADHRPIALHELLYPLLQGYDSVAVEADVEFGGSDQRFNCLVGRELQASLGQRPQVVFLMPLLVGTDGAMKMSQSLGNYIALEAPPDDMFGKVMSIPDHVMMDYFELLTAVPEEELAEMRQSLAGGTVNPMLLKMRLAWEVVAEFHSEREAWKAQEEFVRVFRRRQVPEDVPAVPIPMSADGTATVDIPLVLVSGGVVESRSEAKRLLSQGAIEVDGQRAVVPQAVVRAGSIIKVGPRRWLRIQEADTAAASGGGG